MHLADIKEGTVLNSRLRIDGNLGEGGFAKVFRATDLELDRTVAVKILKMSKLSEEIDQSRFQREARTLAQLRHPNIITVFRLDLLDDGSPLIVMEYLEGQSLESYFLEKGPLSQKICASIFSQICQALSYAHKQGIIHRDLSSANVFLEHGSEPRVKVIDFGLAKLLDESESGRLTLSITSTGSVVGNPSFMSPEQCRGDKLDARSDIYSLGCILYQALCGNPPFRSVNPIEVLVQQQSDYPESPAFNWGDREAEARYRNIVLTCMQKDRDKRFQSVDEVEALLLDDDNTTSKKYFASLHTWAKQEQKRPKTLLITCGVLLGLFACLAIVFNNASLAVLGNSLVKLHNPSFAGMEETIAQQLQASNPACSASLYEDLLSYNCPRAKKASYELNLAELYLVAAKPNKTLELLDKMATDRDLPLDKTQMSKVMSLIELSINNKADVQKELVLRAHLLLKATSMGAAGRGLVSPMIEALLKSLYADNRYSGSREVLLPFALGMTEAYKHYPISLASKIRPESFPFEAVCPREGQALCEAMLSNRGCEASHRSGIREALLRSMVVNEPVRAERTVREFLPISTPLEKVSLYQTVALLEERKQHYKQAIVALEQAIQAQEALRKDYKEVHKRKSINELISLYLIEIQILRKTQDLAAVRALCLKTIALLPNLQQLNEPLNSSTYDITGKLEPEIKLGETWDNQYNYVQVINLCANCKQDDLTEMLLKKYMEYLRAFPESPYKRLNDIRAQQQWVGQLQKLEAYCQRELARKENPSLLQAWRECHELVLATLQKN